MTREQKAAEMYAHGMRRLDALRESETRMLRNAGALTPATQARIERHYTERVAHLRKRVEQQTKVLFP